MSNIRPLGVIGALAAGAVVGVGAGIVLVAGLNAARHWWKIYRTTWVRL